MACLVVDLGHNVGFAILKDRIINNVVLCMDLLFHLKIFNKLMVLCFL